MIRLGGVPVRSRWFRVSVVVAGVGLVAATALWTIPPSSPPGSSPPATSSPSSTAGPSSEPSSSPAEAWAPISLAPYTPVAYLSATKTDAAGVEPESAFTLRSAGSTPASELAAHLEVAPAVALRVGRGASAAEAVITPAVALTPGTSYRFRLRDDDGTIAASWVFRAKQPLHVVTTLPADLATNVPVRTGIEAVLDQDGITGYETRVRVEPAVPNTLELHGRTIAIVPQRDLAPRTLYTVTIVHGIGMSGSDATLERDVVFRFETGGPATTGEPSVRFDDAVVEVSPAEVPALPVDICCPEGSPQIDQDAVVYKLSSVDAAIAAARAIASAPGWSTWSDVGLVPTAGLATAARFRARLAPESQSSFIYVLRFPTKLAAGQYLVVLPRPGRDAQTVLQVTRVATFTEVSQTRMVAWANDVVTGAAVANATVSVSTGTVLGRTDADGLLVVATPATLLEAAGTTRDVPAPAIVVRAPGGATTFSLMGYGGRWRPSDYETDSYYSDAWTASSRYWLVFAADRSLYRSTDTIRTWGVVRARDGGQVSSIEVRLLPESAGPDPAAPPIARATSKLDRSGAFTASLAVSDLPFGRYVVVLVVAGRVVRDSWLSVDEVRKPAYAIEVTTDRHVLIAGETFRATARATYPDGTPVPGLELAFSGQGRGRRATTDADGRAAMTLTATLANNVSRWVEVTPVDPEEGEVGGEIFLDIYPSATWLAVAATREAASIEIVGRAQELDIAGLERAWVSGGDRVPGGDPIGGASVTVSVIRMVRHQQETGRRYDWISKQTVPEYKVWTTDEQVAKVVRTTAPDGRFSLSIPNPVATDAYRVEVSAKDARGRVEAVECWAERTNVLSQRGPYLQAVDAPDQTSGGAYAVGEHVRLAVADAVAPAALGSARFLYLVAQRGLRQAAVGSAGGFDRVFAAADVPTVTISAVEFTGRGLVRVGSYEARVNESTRQIQVVLKTDAATYRPGSQVRLDVRTLGPDGRATPASVVVQAVDEKFYQMGAADVADPLQELYQRLSDGVLWSGTTLALRTDFAGGDTTTGGDTTGGPGGGVRSDFVDTLLFRRITTGADGRASITFKVSDDLTSWRVSAGAVDNRLNAGTASILVPVGLPFFVEASSAPEFLVSDRPVLRLRAYGSALKTGQSVRFTVSAPSLGLKSTTVSGTAFQVARMPLPMSSPGVHRIEVSATTVGRTPALKDALVKTIRVVQSRFEQATTSFQALDTSFVPAGGDGLSTYVIGDAGRGSLISILERLAWSDGARVDQVLGAAVARDLLVEEFGRDAAELPASRFESATYLKEGGVALLPYASGDLDLTAQVALAAPERFDQEALRGLVRRSYGDPESTMTRERGIVALAALAAMGDPVLGELGPFAASPGLTVRERLYLGLAYALLGDDAHARALERSVLVEHGQAMGPWIRLAAGPDRDEVVEATGLLAVLAAALGDPLADRAQAYVEANPPRTTLLALEEIAFVRHSLERLSAEPASFAYTVGGVRQVVDLAAGETKSLSLTAAQRATLRLEPLSGDLGVTTSWVAPAKPGDRPSDPDVTISRSVQPGYSVSEAQIVRVRLTVKFSSTASDGCYEVVDRVPSGLAPLEPGQRELDGQDEKGVVGPYAIEGQTVRFCLSRSMLSHVAGYSARVVSPGTYTWEPASVASTAAAGRVSLTSQSVLTIR